ncbi:MAG: NAD(P)H-hydrate dehydratase [Sulfurimonas sp.]|uniref:NAD(P)H-hydrate dehydratase n=1 Tax=Sulfurimonas sp. TaxID=2022749 RepID=UPI00260E296D|nr:NAD(P)H-hydrate dehydratase [Sulfurimonas sp.]MDD2652030.1 NAD(P)H-hydrate dehydratase [Sulfurimonas sp.]MDD3452061.1 NAD(P)H-hydrate dehydratase [Sulfurimonas sp.]
MQKLFDEVASLDKRCYEEFFLSEDILMEHAAEGMAEYIRNNFNKNAKIIIVCGSGNNGADGIALGRLLHGTYDASLLILKKPSSPMAILQQKRAKSVGVKEIEKLEHCDVLVDAIVGTGFIGTFNAELQNVLEQMNAQEAFKIACDVPSGYLFCADVTLTMGALKKRMFLDSAKEFVGDIKVLDLGVSRDVYEKPSGWNLLDLQDLKLPHRTKKDSHKGCYGHLALALGEKSGASIMSALSALRFGAGLVTLVGYEVIQIPHQLMYSHEVPANATALALGMGLGAEFSQIELDTFLDNSLPLVADADILSLPVILDILKRDNVIVTPHAKEFVALLKITNVANITTEELQKERFKYAELFCKTFPNITLLLKGANVIIGQDERFYINPHGTPALAKGGSGDVLSGLVGALLAQGRTPLEAAINGSLTHAKLALNYNGADFSLTPDDLINEISRLEK